MIKKSVLFLITFLIFIASAQGATPSIYNYLQKVDKQYYLVLGANGKGGDSLAAIDVAVGIKKHNPFKIDIEPVIEGEIHPSRNKILIGHPCDNSLIPLSCKKWPYKKGEAIITVIDNDLIIAGTTVDDTRKAAKIIGNYPNYAILKKESSIIVTGGRRIPLAKDIERAKKKSELVCGDLICEPGESAHCFIDCSQITCFKVCAQEGYNKAACRDKKSNPNVPSCLPQEASKGEGYCAPEKVCCCEKGKNLETTLKETVKEAPSVEKTPPGSFIVVIILITVLVIVGYYLLKGKK